MKVSFIVVAVVAVVVGVVTHQVASHSAVDDALAMLADPAFQADLATIERAMWLPYKGDEEAAVVAPSESKDGVPCALCSIALNEVEGLLAENLTMADLQTAIKNVRTLIPFHNQPQGQPQGQPHNHTPPNHLFFPPSFIVLCERTCERVDVWMCL